MRIIIEIDEEARGFRGTSGVHVSHEVPDAAAPADDGESVDGGPAPGIDDDVDSSPEPAGPAPHDVEAAGAAPELEEGGE